MDATYTEIAYPYDRFYLDRHNFNMRGKSSDIAYLYDGCHLDYFVITITC